MPESSRNIEELIADDFDGDACDHCCRYKRSGLSKSSKILFGLLVDEGFEEKTVLDLGCGTGGFVIEALKHGARSGAGVDLSPAMIKSAKELAATEGLQDRAEFEVENAATGELPRSDIVVMDKVVCCYPDFGPLLKNSIEASRETVGFVVPRDAGIVKVPLRVVARLTNLVAGLRKKRLPFYLHPLRSLDKLLTDGGFSRKRRVSSGMWLVFLYKRPNVQPAS